MEDIKERIVDETIIRFNKVGLKFTIDELVEGMHISKKTVYKLFGNKVELLKYVVDCVFEGISEKEKEIIADDSLDLIEKIKRVIVCLPDKYKDIDFRKVYQIKDKYPEVYEYIIDKIDSSWDRTNRLFIRAMENELIKDTPLVFIRLMFLGCIKQMITSKEVLKIGLSYEEIMEKMVNVIMTGITL